MRSRHYGQFGCYAPQDRDSQRQGSQGYRGRPVHVAIPGTDSICSLDLAKPVMTVALIQGCTVVLHVSFSEFWF